MYMKINNINEIPLHQIMHKLHYPQFNEILLK